LCKVAEHEWRLRFGVALCRGLRSYSRAGCMMGVQDSRRYRGVMTAGHYYYVYNAFLTGSDPG
jgi:hypothetical protein